MSERVPVLLVTANPHVRFALHTAFSGRDDMEVVDEAGTMDDALAFAEKAGRLVAVVHHAPSLVDGVRFAQQVALRRLPVSVVVIADGTDWAPSSPPDVAVLDYWYPLSSLTDEVTLAYRRLDASVKRELRGQ